jgi:hypothetical protein
VIQAEISDTQTSNQKTSKTMKENTYTTSMHLRRPSAGGTKYTIFALAVASLMLAAPAKGDDQRAPELPAPLCDSVNVPEGNRVSSHLYARGVQIYRWNGASWAFVAPDATLFADPCYEGVVGIHYGGPTWEANDGSKVVGVRQADCTPDCGAIPWLRLGANSLSDSGIFARLTYIQRVNTIGGTAPATAGAFIGDEARVPYTAEYYFYREAK